MFQAVRGRHHFGRGDQLESITVDKSTANGQRIRGWIGVCAALLALTLPTATAQAPFVDAAERRVQLPSRVTRVFAAGAPAEVLLYTLVPEMLAGRNRVPEGEAVEFFPPAYRNPIFIKQLPEVDNPSADAEFLALKPDVYIDYGTVQEDYIASVEAVQRRTRVPGLILDGALTLIPDTYRRLGAALGVADRGERLAAAADRIMTKYRNVLASTSAARACISRAPLTGSCHAWKTTAPGSSSNGWAR